MARRILIYKDAGAECVEVLQRAVLRSLKALGMQTIKVDYINAKAISTNPTWKKNALLFVLPGGRDVPYVDKLQGHGDHAIRDFVSNGGSYLGICAGAYYACRYCEFQKGTDMEICADRDLHLLPAIARGCVYSGFHYSSCAGAQVIELKLSKYLQANRYMAAVDTLKAYYNGGCEIILDKEKSQNHNVEVLAHYADFSDKVAVTFSNYGQGRVILSGVHPEFEFKMRNDANYSRSAWAHMQEYAGAQKNFLTALLGLLL